MCIRDSCLAHGRRKFTELEEAFPDECAVVTEALRQVFDHEEEVRRQQMSAEARLGYHQQYNAWCELTHDSYPEGAPSR